MAAVASLNAPLDMNKTCEYPITLSARLQSNSEESARRLATVKVNGQQDLSKRIKGPLSLRSDNGSENCTLTLTHESSQEQQVYNGTKEPSAKYILVFNPETQTFILDKIDADFTFNSGSAHTNDRNTSLTPEPASEFVSSDEDVFGEPVDERDPDEPDPNNGYDYRHYLKEHPPSSPEPVEQDEEEEEDEEGGEDRGRTPNYHHPPPRPMRSHHLEPEHDSSPPREDEEADNEDSDDGGLTIVDPGKKTRHRYADSFDSDKAPISMRSAASSVRRNSSAEEESDEDVEDMKLPSPVRQKAAVEREEDEEEDREEEEEEEEGEGEEEEGDDVAMEDVDGGDEDVDLLEAELVRELEKGNSQLGEQRVETYAAESSSESEEE